MNSLSHLREFEKSSPVETTRMFTLTKESADGKRPAFKLEIALGETLDIEALQRKTQYRRDNTSDVGREHNIEYRKAVASYVRGWIGCRADAIGPNSAWLVKRPQVLNAMPKDDAGVFSEIPYDRAGVDFLFEILDIDVVDIVLDAVGNTEAFWQDQRREKKE